MEKKLQQKILSSRQSFRKAHENSPYSKNFKCYIRSDERDLLYKRQKATKLTRKDLEDKYIELCDENFFLKRLNNENEDKIKKLTAKLIRVSEVHRSFSSASILKENFSDRKHVERYKEQSGSERGNKIISRASSTNAIFKKSKEYLSNKSDSITSCKGSNEITEKGMRETSEKFNNEVISVQEKFDLIKTKLEQETNLCIQLKMENATLEERLTQTDMKKFVTENVEINRFKRKLERARDIVQKLRDQNQKISLKSNSQIQAVKIENCEMTKRLREELARNSILSEKLEELNNMQRTIETLRRQVSELEFDKKSLIEQQENFSELIKETASYKQIQRKAANAADVQELLEKMEKLETEKASIENSKNEMFKKVRYLQDLNDKLMVDLEGFKVEKSFSDEIDHRLKTEIHLKNI